MRMTISLEAVMQRCAGALGPQNVSGFAAGAQKLDLSGLHVPLRQQPVAVAAADVLCLVHTFLTV
jgi:hypothetical protein